MNIILILGQGLRDKVDDRQMIANGIDKEAIAGGYFTLLILNNK